jgi:hypothetical protein|tara:strand:- start:2676 stop:3503 length:828 start_codon:yes stop_codon:yes gene_type:complete
VRASAFYLLLLLCISAPIAKAQVAFEIVSPEKKKFFLFVNGLKENETSKFKVRIKNLQEGPHHIKVIFENKELNNPQIKLNFEPGKDYKYEIKLYSNLDRKWYAINLIEVSDWSEKQIKKKVGIDTLSFAELKTAEVKADSILKVGLPKLAIAKPKDTVLIKSDTVKKKLDLKKLNCTTPLRPDGFILVNKKISEEALENQKLAVAKKLIQENCLSAIQLMELIQLFDFEVSKLEMAIFAYPYCFDPMNYNFVEDVFEYESSVTKLHNEIYASKK